MSTDQLYFPASKHLIFQLLYVLFPMALMALVMLGVGVEWKKGASVYYLSGGMLLIVLLILLSVLSSKAFYKAGYTVDRTYLHYRCGINTGKIPLQNIHAVRLSTYPVAGNRPALDLKGVTVTYGEGYQIFLSPENPLDFMACIQARQTKVDPTKT